MPDRLDILIERHRQVIDSINVLSYHRAQIQAEAAVLCTEEFLLNKYGLKTDEQLHAHMESLREFLGMCRNYWLNDDTQFKVFFKEIRLDEFSLSVNARIVLAPFRYSDDEFHTEMAPYPFQPDMEFWVPIQLVTKMKGG